LLVPLQVTTTFVAPPEATSTGCAVPVQPAGAGVSHKLQDGTDYYTINPKVYVPLLEFDDGTRLAEGPAIVQWVADPKCQRSGSQLLPAPWR